MPVIQNAEDLQGALLEGGVRVGPPVGTEPGLFWGESSSDGSIPGEVFIRFIPDRPGEPVLERFLEATYFRNDNLLRCYGAGIFEAGPQRLVYAILEPWQETLADRLRGGPMSMDEAAALGRDLADALIYLHRQNLVCCALDMPTVANADGRVKIADYSQMRVAGDTYATETRRLLAAGPAVPPEAFEGVVTPAWDAWSLGTVLVAAVTEKRGRDEQRRPNRDLPEPFRSIVSDCLVSDPQRRCSVEQMREMLDGGRRVEATQHDVVAETPIETEVERGIRAESAEPEPRYYTVHDGHSGKRPWWPWAAAGAAVGVGAMIAALTINSGPERQTPYHAPAPAAQVAQANKPEPAVPVPGQQPAVDNTGVADRGRTDGAQTSDEQRIRTVLDRWIQAQRSGDAGAQAAYYAPHVDAYYGARRVTRDWVKRSREQTLAKVSNIRVLNIQNVKVNVDHHGRAVVTLDKSWDFGNNYSGAVQQQLILRKITGDWRIVSERDTRVYRKNPGA